MEKKPSIVNKAQKEGEYRKEETKTDFEKTKYCIHQYLFNE